MSETVLRILLDELNLIRIVCKGCGAVLELSVNRLDGEGSIMKLACPGGCQTVYRVPESYQSDALAKLADALKALRKVSGYQIEFVLPDPDKKS
jgi:hypothetical protein